MQNIVWLYFEILHLVSVSLANGNGNYILYLGPIFTEMGPTLVAGLWTYFVQHSY